MVDTVHVINLRIFNQLNLKNILTLRSDRLCDDHGHPDLATDSTRCLHTLRKQS